MNDTTSVLYPLYFFGVPIRLAYYKRSKKKKKIATLSNNGI